MKLEIRNLKEERGKIKNNTEENNKTLENEINILKEENENLNKQLRYNQIEIQQLKIECDKRYSTIKKLNEENNSSKQNYEDQLNKIKEINSKFKEENEKYKKDNEFLNNEKKN